MMTIINADSERIELNASSLKTNYGETWRFFCGHNIKAVLVVVSRHNSGIRI